MRPLYLTAPVNNSNREWLVRELYKLGYMRRDEPVIENGLQEIYATKYMRAVQNIDRPNAIGCHDEIDDDDILCNSPAHLIATIKEKKLYK